MNFTKKLELNKETLRNLASIEAAGVNGGDTGTLGTKRPALTITICDGDSCNDWISRRVGMC